MKKIGIATIVALDNFGALLQGYALQKKIEQLGYDAEIMDLREKNQNDCSMFVKVRSVKDILRNLRKLLRYSDYKKRMSIFSKFASENIKLSRNYPDENSLKNAELDYDLLCTGSDQTFNLRLPVFKKAYYLDFNDNIPKVSYASSFGEQSLTFSDEEKVWIKEQLLKYRHISVREEKGVELAKAITGRNDIVKTVDPTLLLDRKMWNELVNESYTEKEEYILFYSVLSAPWVVNEVKRISKLTGLRVIVPHLQNQFEIGADFERRLDVGPCEFMALIKNAKLVLTTSFHATVFSIIFQKPFYSFVLGEGNRIGSLLSMLELEERLITESGKNVNTEQIDFANAESLLNSEREKSIEYLEKVLKEIRLKEIN